MSESLEEPEKQPHKHGVWFHVWLVLKRRPRIQSSPKRSFFPNLKILFRRREDPAVLEGVKSKRLSFKFIAKLLRRPNFGRFSTAFQRFFHSMFFFVKRPSSPVPLEQTKSVGTFYLSLKRIAETGKVGIAEDIALVRTFFRKLFRLPQPVEEPLPRFMPVKIFGRRLKDPKPKIHLFKLFLNQPRQAFSLLGQRTWHLIVAVASQWKPVTAVTLFFALSLEISLHLTSTAGWALVQILHLFTPKAPQVALFIGDAFTSGEFAAGNIKSYTDFVPDILKKEGLPNWNAISYSSQHADTTNIVDALPGLISREDPRFVYFMIGGDDLMQGSRTKDFHPPSKSVAESVPKDWLLTLHLYRKWRKDPSARSLLDFFTVPPFYITNFQLERINPKEMELQIQKLLKQTPKDWSLPPSATWYSYGGPARWNGKELSVWNLKPLLCSAPEKYCEMEENPNDVRFLEREGTDLILSGESLGDFVVINSTLEHWDPNKIRARYFESIGWQYLRVGSMEQAGDQFKQSGSLNPDSPLTHAGLAEIAYRSGNYQRLKEEVAWLKKKYETNPGLITGRAVIQSYSYEYSPYETIKLTLDVLKKYPQNPWLWETLADSFYRLGHESIANMCIHKALALIPERMKPARGSLLRLQAKIQVHSNQEEASQALVQAYLLDHNSELFEKTLSENSDLYQLSTFQSILNRLSVAESDKKELLFSFKQAVETQASHHLQSYRNRLITLVDMCLKANVHPVLVTYPIPQPQVGEIMQSVSEMTGASWLNLSSQFEIILQKENKNQSLLRYGIPTNEGNRRIAEIFAKDIASRRNSEK